MNDGCESFPSRDVLMPLDRAGHVQRAPPDSRMIDLDRFASQQRHTIRQLRLGLFLAHRRWPIVAFSFEESREHIDEKISRLRQRRAFSFQFVELEEGFFQVFGSRFGHLRVVLERISGTRKHESRNQKRSHFAISLFVFSCFSFVFLCCSAELLTASERSWETHSGDIAAACHSSRMTAATARVGPKGGPISSTAFSNVASNSSGSGSTSASFARSRRLISIPSKSAI